MTNSSPKVITRSEARQEINQFGYILVFFLLLQLILRVSLRVLDTSLADTIRSFDPDAFQISGLIIIYLLTTFVLFPFANRKLNLPIRDYLRVPKLGFLNNLGTIFTGVSIALLSTMVVSLMPSIAATSTVTYASVGKFGSVLHTIENALYFLMFVVLKPICDEYMFRGTVQRLLGHYGRYFGIYGSALLYAICQPDLLHAIPALFIGWYLAVTNLRYHSIQPGIRVSICISFTMWVLEIMPGNLLWLSTAIGIVILIVTLICVATGHVYTKIPRYNAMSFSIWSLLLSSSSFVLCALLFVLSMLLKLWI